MLKFKIADSTLYNYLLAASFALIALILSKALWPLIGGGPFIFSFGAVALSAWRGGLGPGMLSAALAIVGTDYLLIEPVGQVFNDPSDVVLFGIFSLVTLLISTLEESRHRSEQSLRDIRDELAVILDSIPDGITAQDVSGRPVFANTFAAFLTGYPSIDVMINTPVTDLQRKYEMFDEDSNPLGYSALPRHHVFRHRETASLTFKMQFKDTKDEKWISLTSSPVFDAQGNVKLAVNVFRDITQDVETQRELLRYAAIVQNSNDAIIGKSLDGIITSWNPGAEQIYGYSAADAIGQPITLIVPDSIHLRELELLERLRQGERIQHYETKRVHKDGHLVSISLTISPIRTPNGQLVGYSTIERDITERNRLHDLLALEQRKLTTILNTIPGIVYQGSGDEDAGVQRMDYISRYAEEMLGYSLNEWKAHEELGAPVNFWKKIIHPDDWEFTIQKANETYKLGIPGPVPFRVITKDNRILHVEAYNAVITDQNGERVGTSGVVLDVTERRQREQEIIRLTSLIESQRQRLNAIIRNVPGIIYDVTFNVADSSQTLNYISDYAEKMVGYPPNEWYGNFGLWEEIIEPEDWQAALEEARTAFEEERPGNAQMRLRNSSGETLFTEAFFNFTMEETGEVRQYGVLMDITRRKAAEDTLNEYMEELRRSNEELEQFAYVASHDLQEPLRMVTSYLQLIERRYADKLDADGREFIDFAVDGASRMKLLINDLLTYSRVQRNTDEFTTVSLENVLARVTKLLQVTISETNAEITHDQLPDVVGLEGQMFQLFQNLISNALKFRGEAAPQIHISVQRDKRYWHFSVRDNGIGIAPEYQERIFVIFQRLHTRDQYAGTGIGLAICRKIVVKHGGKIWVESQPGEGSTFHFTVPIKRRKRLTHNATHRDTSGGG
ncbi:MAG: hypothetical protein OHK0046_45520 [Anaerolineae bacterium]